MHDMTHVSIGANYGVFDPARVLHRQLKMVISPSLTEAGQLLLACWCECCLSRMSKPTRSSPFGACEATAFEPGTRGARAVAWAGEVAANLSFALQYFEKESAVQFLSYFDSLTGLAKRVLFCERLATRLTARKAEEPQPAVAVIDIEHLRGS